MKHLIAAGKLQNSSTRPSPRRLMVSLPSALSAAQHDWAKKAVTRAAFHNDVLVYEPSDNIDAIIECAESHGLMTESRSWADLERSDTTAPDAYLVFITEVDRRTLNTFDTPVLREALESGPPHTVAEIPSLKDNDEH